MLLLSVLHYCTFFLQDVTFKLTFTEFQQLLRSMAKMKVTVNQLMLFLSMPLSGICSVNIYDKNLVVQKRKTVSFHAVFCTEGVALSLLRGSFTCLNDFAAFCLIHICFSNI